uniref:Uncharacterized protein n=1 Tax=Rhizophora mucronata TaxID=61149 RepID=A0A2P2MYZ7_RHIMU
MTCSLTFLIVALQILLPRQYPYRSPEMFSTGIKVDLLKSLCLYMHNLAPSGDYQRYSF